MRLPEMNEVFVSGRLTNDPKIMATQAGKAVVTCNVAVNRRTFDQNAQEWKDDTVFVPVVVWGEQANRLKDKLFKGTPVFVQGRLTSAEYQNKEGQKVRYLQITASRVQVLESAKEATEPVEQEVEEDEVPF